MTARKTLRNCLDCGKALRPMAANKADWPGTIIHQGRGLCSKHYKKRTESGTLNDVPLVQGPRPVDDDAPGTIPADRLQKMQRDAIDFHRGWRKRTGRDWTQPINLREIVMAAA